MTDDERRRQQIHREKLVERYEQRWGQPPWISLDPESPETWKKIERAVRTNKPIKITLPKGAIA